MELRDSIVKILNRIVIPTIAVILILSMFSTSLIAYHTAMAASLTGIRALPAANIVNTKTTFEILFTTATTAAIKTITVAFPSNFGVQFNAVLVERSGIGAGTSSNSGSTFTYTVAGTPPSVPAGTQIRLEISGIINANTPASNYVVTVTTINSANSAIDGPTTSSAFIIKQIGTNDIANGAITSSKLVANSVTTKNIVTGAVTTPKIASGQ
jgi:hypothetical protein